MSLSQITKRLESSLKSANRSSNDASLIAVSKIQPDERTRVVLEEGHRIFGENTVQEAARKWPNFKEEFENIQLHLIGPLQTNKARQAMQLTQYIHTLDRPKLAHTLARLAQELGHCPKLFIQINTGQEPQKAGIPPEDADIFIQEARKMDLPIEGLMCIPPVHEEPSLHFALLAKIAKRNDLKGLSMGMSQDFETALAFGATHVRVGSAIFGERVYE